MKNEIPPFEHNESERTETLPLDFSGRKEWEKILKDEGISSDVSLELSNLDLETQTRLKERGAALQALEKMLISRKEYTESIPTSVDIEKKKEKIKKEICDLLNMPSSFGIFPRVMEEIIPIHQYFRFLIEQKKANDHDERLYIKKRYGWGKEEFPFEVWDTKLARLNTHWRAFILDMISKEEFENQIHNL